MSDRVDGLRADIERAPEALGNVVATYGGTRSPLRALAPRDLVGRRVLFIGQGSSRFAALDVAHACRTAGIGASVDYASMASAPPSRDLVLVAVSASGRTPEVVAAAERHRGTSLVVAVTNDERSVLAATADVVLPLVAGSEASGISTLTSRATVAVLALLGALLGGPSLSADDLRAAVDALADLRSDRAAERFVQRAADALDGAPSIDVIGPAWRVGSMAQAALMLREAPRLPASAYETADWLHSAVYLALPRHRALLSVGSPADAEVTETIERRGGAVIRIEPDPPIPAVPASLRAIVESVVFDRIALELWRRATADG